MSDNIPILSGLSDIAQRYDALLCDVWGVVHNGREVFDGVAAALTAFRKERGPVLLLTNAPRPSSVIPAQLDRLGLPAAAYDGVVTSGDATRAELSARAPGPAFHLGPDRDDALFEGTGLERAALDTARFIICTGLWDDETETPEDYRAFFNDALAKGLPLLCANPDIIVKRGDKTIYCAGALAAFYTELGGQSLYVGKPHDPIYNLAYERLAQIVGRKVEKSKVLAIGDGMGTDIAGANGQDVDVLFIGGGIHGAEAQGDDGALDGERLNAFFAAEGRTAIGALPRLVW